MSSVNVCTSLGVSSTAVRSTSCKLVYFYWVFFINLHFCASYEILLSVESLNSIIKIKSNCRNYIIIFIK